MAKTYRKNKLDIKEKEGRVKRYKCRCEYCLGVSKKKSIDKHYKKLKEEIWEN